MFLITESTNDEKRKIFLSGRRTRGRGSPGQRRTCLYSTFVRRSHRGSRNSIASGLSGERASDDNDAIYAELKRQLGNQTPGDRALPRQMLIATHVGGLGGLEDSQNQLPETEKSLDLSQTSIDWDLTFLDSDGSNQGSLDNGGGGVDSPMSNRLSLSLEDSRGGEAWPGVSGALEQTSGRQDGVNTTEGA